MNRKAAIVLAFIAGAAVLYVAVGMSSGSWNPFKKAVTV